MILIDKNLIGLRPTGMNSIVGWKVMFRTPYGLADTVENARELVESIIVSNNDRERLNIENIIKPVVVAFDKFDYMEVVER